MCGSLPDVMYLTFAAALLSPAEGGIFAGAASMGLSFTYSSVINFDKADFKGLFRSLSVPSKKPL